MLRKQVRIVSARPTARRAYSRSVDGIRVDEDRDRADTRRAADDEDRRQDDLDRRRDDDERAGDDEARRADDRDDRDRDRDDRDSGRDDDDRDSVAAIAKAAAERTQPQAQAGNRKKDSGQGEGLPDVEREALREKLAAYGFDAKTKETLEKWDQLGGKVEAGSITEKDRLRDMALYLWHQIDKERRAEHRAQPEKQHEREREPERNP